jgi:hypothetical protein
MRKTTCQSKSTITKHILIITAGLLWAGLTQAQEAANTSGGEATGTGGAVSYSIGQVVYTTNTGSSGSVAQGVQQSYQILTVGNEETTLNISLTLFPNPATDYLTIQISNFDNEKLTYQLSDLNGKLLSFGSITGRSTLINMSSMPTATYLVNILNQENKTVQLFKIIKY